MASFTIKKIPDPLLARLRDAAARHRRSLNSEILVCLESSVGSSPVDVSSLLVKAKSLRDRMQGPPLSVEEVRAAKVTGRS